MVEYDVCDYNVSLGDAFLEEICVPPDTSDIWSYLETQYPLNPQHLVIRVLNKDSDENHIWHVRAFGPDVEQMTNILPEFKDQFKFAPTHLTWTWQNKTVTVYPMSILMDKEESDDEKDNDDELMECPIGTCLLMGPPQFQILDLNILYFELPPTQYAAYGMPCRKVVLTEPTQFFAPNACLIRGLLFRPVTMAQFDRLYSQSVPYELTEVPLLGPVKWDWSKIERRIKYKIITEPHQLMPIRVLQHVLSFISSDKLAPPRLDELKADFDVVPLE